MNELQTVGKTGREVGEKGRENRGRGGRRKKKKKKGKERAQANQVSSQRRVNRRAETPTEESTIFPRSKWGQDKLSSQQWNLTHSTICKI